MGAAVRFCQQTCRKQTGAAGGCDRAGAIAGSRHVHGAGRLQPGDGGGDYAGRNRPGRWIEDFLAVLSKALVTFTLRNANDYPVKDIELFCSFLRRDGSHLTDRRRLISDVVNMKSRKTFARMHIGFINVNADRARCSLVAASHV
jgi:hypothetical protein